LIFLLLISIYHQNLKAQPFTQTLKGTVFDIETHQPVPGVVVTCSTCSPAIHTITDSTGQFRLLVPVGRHSISLSHVGYNGKVMNDILVVSGKEISLAIGLVEKIYNTSEITVKGTSTRWINPMATVSARTLRNQDAAMYAGGFFDPSRMVANFPGVASGLSDESNEIVVRGNSPRGLMWRLEGIEIPNPNHFSSGEGASGGGYSSVSTNVLSGFDFFTSAFPAEFGNAGSGVMDLTLRNGNADKQEHSLALSVLGAEVSSEGPINEKKDGSYLADFRYGDFGILTRYGIIDNSDMSIAPKTLDWAVNTSIKTKTSGTFSFFSVGAASKVGDRTSTGEIINGGDDDEYIDHHFTAVAGVKHSIQLKNNKTYIKTTAGFTFEKNSSRDNNVDSLANRTEKYVDSFQYPAYRVATLFNHKLNSGNSLRFGANLNFVSGDLFVRNLASQKVDTLIDSRVQGWYSGSFLQWKHKTTTNIETNAGIHFFYSGITHEFIAEPRFGLILNLPHNQSINLGAGKHSRLEPLSIYHYRVKVSSTSRDDRNLNLKSTKALHLVLGYNKTFGKNILFTIEGYTQFLYDVPVAENSKSTYSVLNLVHGLPDVILVNNGKGRNKGVELTLEKVFSHNYYFLFTASVFDSKYLASDGKWYNTYFNTNYVYNLSAGKEVPLGKYNRNIIGFKLRSMLRGGFRYTPVDNQLSLTKKKIVYVSDVYSERLPGFRRVDAGVSYRLNSKMVAWSFQADIQNVLDTENVLRRKFSYANKQVLATDSKTFGLIPIFTVRADF
jgi:hypothetical protein